MIVCMQGLQFVEKFWIKVCSVLPNPQPLLTAPQVWTEAYEKGAELLYVDYIHGPSTYAPALLPLYLPSLGSRLEQGLPSANDDPFFFVGVYALIGAVSLLAMAIIYAMTYVGAFIASRRLFRRLLGSVMTVSHPQPVY